MSDVSAVELQEPRTPAIIRWTGWLVALPMLLLMGACAAVTLGLDQPDFMARPGMLFSFGILMLALATSMLVWRGTWADHLEQRTRWRRRSRGVVDWDRPGSGWQRIHLACCGVYCAADGIALLVGGFIRL